MERMPQMKLTVAHFITLQLITLIISGDGALHYVFFSILILLAISEIVTLPCSQQLSIYIPFVE
jgi:hypothetical protein